MEFEVLKVETASTVSKWIEWVTMPSLIGLLLRVERVDSAVELLALFCK